ncbi:hypothetical protein ACFE04_006699 [Oxalis oulophora]
MSKNNQNIFSLPKHPQPPFHQAFTNIQTHFTNFLQNISSFTNHLQNQSKNSLNSLNLSSSSSAKSPLWARINNTQMEKSTSVEERLAGVPVYALSNSNEEFVLVSGVSTGKSLGLLCFKKEDAETLLQQMKSMDPGMRREGSKVVAVALNKVFQLKVDGVAFRFIPESSQVQHALMEKERAGISDDNGFPGVPVFQSKSLVLRSQKKSYRPVFFRKEDLEKSLERASNQQNLINPSIRQGDIQVAVFEDIIKGMKEGSGSMWDDVVFIPPGFDVSVYPSKQGS